VEEKKEEETQKKKTQKKIDVEVGKGRVADVNGSDIKGI
jgi:hypothetical protein